MSSSIAVRGHRVTADVPPQVSGENLGPLPVDLLASVLGACIAFRIAQWCKEASLPCEGLAVTAEYAQEEENHCRPMLRATIMMPRGFPEERREALLEIAEQCTGHDALSRAPELEIAVAQQSAAA